MKQSKERIQLVASKNKIEDVVAEHTKLKKCDDKYVGNCPICHEEDGNLNVVPMMGIFFCFKCNEGGDVFSFMQKCCHISFCEAVDVLAESCGLDVPIVMSADESPDRVGIPDVSDNEKMCIALNVRGIGGALAKACIDPFDYAAKLRSGEVVLFESCTMLQEDWVLLDGVRNDDPANTLTLPAARGICVRHQDIVWVMDAPRGS